MNRLYKKGQVKSRQRSTDQLFSCGLRGWVLQNDLLLEQPESPHGGIKVFKKQNHSYARKRLKSSVSQVRILAQGVIPRCGGHPSIINGWPVTSLADFAFFKWTNLIASGQSTVTNAIYGPQQVFLLSQ
jgi:hypothetical protein